MSDIHVIGDPNSAGGVISSTPQSTFRVNSKLVSVDGSIGSSHENCPVNLVHCEGNWATANGVSSFRVEGIPVNVKGDADTCGHTRANGQVDFQVSH